jgi:hypothetical protein
MFVFTNLVHFRGKIYTNNNNNAFILLIFLTFYYNLQFFGNPVEIRLKMRKSSQNRFRFL